MNPLAHPPEMIPVTDRSPSGESKVTAGRVGAAFVNRFWRGVLLCFAGVVSAWAHDPGLSVATARVSGGQLLITLAMARADIAPLAKLETNYNASVNYGGLGAVLPRLQNLCRGAFVVSCADRLATLAPGFVQSTNQTDVQIQMTFSGLSPGSWTIHSALLAKLPRGHRQFLSVRDEQGTLLGERMLDAAHATLTIDCAQVLPAAVVRHSWGEFVTLGVRHIATGYDHLLFLLGLLLVGGSLRSAVPIITSFTCAHSITLALATLNVIHVPARIIEPLIAASIIYVGLENILHPHTKGRWRLTFAFGLVHGCGFASALRDLGVGSNGLSIVAPLVSFNFGVELGQMTIAALALPMIWRLRDSPVLVHRLVPVGSALIAVAGGFWLVERTLF
jgi:hydrogenase/urease accessory protein HupE